VELVPDYVAAANSDGPEQRAEANELAAWLRAAVAMLPARSAQVFSLSYFAELSHAEIAAELSISSDAVGVALHRARASIAEMYHKAENTCGGSKHD
jgi:RNA polymerase sigma factor (sigma-70 family)